MKKKRKRNKKSFKNHSSHLKNYWHMKRANLKASKSIRLQERIKKERGKNRERKSINEKCNL